VQACVVTASSSRTRLRQCRNISILGGSIMDVFVATQRPLQ
jgi:hypothetical protein